VTSLSVDLKTGDLISGSWDGTAKVWKLHDDGTATCIQTLPGHENGVCVLGLPNGTVATGSAGQQAGNAVTGFQIRIWKNGKEIKSLRDHESAVRSLALSNDQQSFFSSSNDGSVRQYSLKGELLHTMRNPVQINGSVGFCFSVTTSVNGEILTGNDDCCVRVWAGEDLIQEIWHPCTVWCVYPLPNGDIATAGSDGIVRVFTRDKNRQAADMVREYYKTETQKVLEEIANKQSGGRGIDVSKLKKIEDAQPGTKDGDIKMFSNDGKAFVYQWSGVSQTWVAVGEALGSAEGGGEIDGVTYDKVLPIEIEDPATGGLRKVEIGINNGDNPYVIAQEFAAKYGLPESHVHDIVQYINQNRGGASGTPMIDMSAGQETAPMQVDEGPRDAQTNQFPLLNITGFSFQKAPWDKIMDKIVDDFNKKVADDVKLSLKEIDTLETIVEILKKESRYHASTITKTQTSIFNKLLKWDTDYIFPVLDVARMVLCHPLGAEAFGSDSCRRLLEISMTKASENGAKLPVVLTGIRVLTNVFRHVKGAEFAVDALSTAAGVNSIAAPIKDLTTFPNKSVRNSLATACLNIANAIYHSNQQGTTTNDLLSLIGDSAIELASIAIENKEEETTRRCLAAVGCLLKIIPSGSISQLQGTLDNAEKFAEPSSSLKTCIDEVRIEVSKR